VDKYFLSYFPDIVYLRGNTNYQIILAQDSPAQFCPKLRYLIMNKKGSYVLVVVIIILVLIGGFLLLRPTQKSPVSEVGLTAGTCIHANPTVSITPAAGSGYTSQGVQYQLYIKNNDSGNNCQVSMFNYAAFMPPLSSYHQFWASQSSTYIPPGSYTYIPVTATPPLGTPAGQYSFIYNVVNGSNSTFSATTNTATHTVLALNDTTPPSAVSSLQMLAQTADGIVAKWNPSTDNIGIAGYDVYVNGTLVPPFPNPNFGFSPTTTYFTYMGTVSSFSVKSRDYAGNTPTGTAATIAATSVHDTTAPTAPSNVTVSNITSTSATISWGASTDNTYVASYAVFDAASSRGLGALCKVPGNQTSCTVYGLSSNTRYNLSVLAYDIANNRGASRNTAVQTLP